MPSHYLNQCWVIVNWTLRNKLQWHFIQNMKLFIHENASQNIVCKMTAISTRGRWLNKDTHKALNYWLFVRRNHWWLVVSHNGPIILKIFQCHDVFMYPVFAKQSSIAYLPYLPTPTEMALNRYGRTCVTRQWQVEQWSIQPANLTHLWSKIILCCTEAPDAEHKSTFSLTEDTPLYLLWRFGRKNIAL